MPIGIRVGWATGTAAMVEWYRALSAPLPIPRALLAGGYEHFWGICGMTRA